MVSGAALSPATPLATSPPSPSLESLGVSPGMNILLLGSGGREHALAWKLAQSRFIGEDGGTLYACPGNPGIDEYAELVEFDVGDHAAVGDFCAANGVDFVVVGP